MANFAMAEEVQSLDQNIIVVHSKNSIKMFFCVFFCFFWPLKYFNNKKNKTNWNISFEIFHAHISTQNPNRTEPLSEPNTNPQIMGSFPSLVFCRSVFLQGGVGNQGEH